MIKQPKFWTNKNFISNILLPVSIIFLLLSKIRNLLQKKLKSKLFVICIGNITIGGTGKTPTVMFFAEQIKKLDFKPIILSKGYGGKLTGPKKVITKHKTFDVGDEAVMHSLYNETWISKKRSKAIRMIEKQSSNRSLILMDDGLQNNSIYQDLKICIFDGSMGLGNSRILPSGPLRESLISGLKKTNIAIIIGEDKNNIQQTILKNREHVNVYNGVFVPDKNTIQELNNKKLYAFAGIGIPDKFYELLKSFNLNLIKTKSFPDHYKYKEHDLQKLVKESKELKLKLITTEKDFIKIKEIVPNISNQIIPLKIKLKINNKDQLIEKIKSAIYEKN